MEKYPNGPKPRTIAIKWLVYHATGGGGTLHWVLMPKPGTPRFKRYARGIALFHYLILIDGTVIQLVPNNLWVYNSSTGSKDKGTIGIELENKSPSQANQFTHAQYASLNELTVKLMDDIPSIENIISHNQIKKKYGKTGTGKNCPGPNFEYGKVASFLISAGYNFRYIAEHFTEIWRG